MSSTPGVTISGKQPVLLGLGANLGRPAEQLAAALRRLSTVVEVAQVSSVYRSAPVGYADQPDFLNLVCRAWTGFAPCVLIGRVQDIERTLGRVRSFPNAPRAIDIDVLAYADLVLDTPELILPHPRLHRRAFVLVPLAEIAPEWRHPVLGKTAAELLAEGGQFERIERWGKLPPELP